MSPLLLLLFAVPLVSGLTCPEDWGPGDLCRCSKTTDGFREYTVECDAKGRTSYSLGELDRLRGVNDSRWHLTLKNMFMRHLPPVASSAKSLTIANTVFYLRKPVRMEWPWLSRVRFEEVWLMHSPWSLIEGAKKIDSFTVKGGSLIPTIGKEFRQVPSSVLELTLEHTGTTTIEPGSMTHLTYLILIDFLAMPFRVFPRSALPEKLPVLTIMSLKYTLMEKLEPAFFDGMPNLGLVLLEGNKFTTLDSSWFKPKPRRIEMTANPLRCSCDLLWIKQELKMKQSEFYPDISCYNSAKTLEKIEDLDEKVYC